MMPQQAARMLEVRVSRRGWRRRVQPTIEELGEAVERAIEDMRTSQGHLRFRAPEKAEDFICSRVRAELQVAVMAEFDADEVDADQVETGAQLIKIFTERVGPVYVLLEPAPVKPPPPVQRVGLAASPKGAA